MSSSNAPNRRRFAVGMAFCGVVTSSEAYHSRRSVPSLKVVSLCMISGLCPHREISSRKAAAHGLFMQLSVYLPAKVDRRREMNWEDVTESLVDARVEFELGLDLQ